MSDRRGDQSGDQDDVVLPVVIVEVAPPGSDDGPRHDRPALSGYIDPELVNALADWHRQYVTSAPPARSVGFEQRGRAGYPEEIQLTLRSRPREAKQAAAGMTELDSTVRRLRVDASTMRATDRELSWDVVLRAPLWRRRRATLRLFASPSSNVSVLTLVPTKPHRVARKHFIRAGVRALAAVCERIDAEVDALVEARAG
jgi:hypothetical protein